MAKLTNLTVGGTYPVRSGNHAGQSATVLSTVQAEDGDQHARKIPVRINGKDTWILPRLLDDGVPTESEARRIIRTGAPLVPTAQPLAAPATPAPVVDEEHVPLTDPDDPRLDAFRPDPKDPEIKNYISRTLPGGRSDIDVLLDYKQRGKNVLLVGDTQSGKTLLVRVLAVEAAKRDGRAKPYPVFTLSGSEGISNYELFGQSVPYTDPHTGQERLVWLPGVVSLAAQVGGFLYLDEVSALEPRVTQALHPLCDSRRCFINYARPQKIENDGFVPETVDAHPDLWVIGTYNEGYAGTGRLNEALVNRFVTLPWGYDEAVEKKLVTSGTVRLLAEALRSAREARNISSPVGTRLLQELEESALLHGAEFALWAFTGSFPGRDRERVQAIIEDRSILSLLTNEVIHAQGVPSTSSETVGAGL